MELLVDRWGISYQGFYLLIPSYFTFLFYFLKRMKSQVPLGFILLDNRLTINYVTNRTWQTGGASRIMSLSELELLSSCGDSLGTKTLLSQLWQRRPLILVCNLRTYSMYGTFSANVQHITLYNTQYPLSLRGTFYHQLSSIACLG